jgi:hypothetical protein
MTLAAHPLRQIVYHPTSSTDQTLVPGASARVDFFRRGATVAAAQVIPTGTSIVQVTATGRLAAGSQVSVGLAGGSLAVSEILSASQLRVVNSTGAAISVAAGTRLILQTDRPVVARIENACPEVFDPSGAVANEAGWVSVELDDVQCDYVVTPPVLIDNTTGPETLPSPSTASFLEWSHQVGAHATLLVVAVAWQEFTGEETLDSVTYDGVAMTLAASVSGLDVYYLENPTHGLPKTIRINWSGTGRKGAVAGAVSFRGALAAHPVAQVVTSQGNSAAPFVSMIPGQRGGMVFAALGIASATTVVSTSPLAG